MSHGVGGELPGPTPGAAPHTRNPCARALRARHDSCWQGVHVRAAGSGHAAGCCHALDNNIAQEVCRSRRRANGGRARVTGVIGCHYHSCCTALSRFANDTTAAWYGAKRAVVGARQPYQQHCLMISTGCAAGTASYATPCPQLLICGTRVPACLSAAAAGLLSRLSPLHNFFCGIFH
jgi:hypothetical protein